MARVTGFGGFFFKAQNPGILRNWYQQSLGFNCDEYGTTFVWKQFQEPDKDGFTVWSPFGNDTTYFNPSQKEFMIDLRVDDLEGLLANLEQKGVKPLDPVEEYEYGRFVRIMDPEGKKIELWEPNDEVFGKILKKTTPER